MAGEQYVLEQEFDWYSSTPFQNNQIVQLDANAAHSTPQNAAVQLPTAAGQPVIGVVKDAAHVDALTGLPTSTGVNVRIMGISRVIASAPITVGQYVQSTGTTGQAVGATSSATFGGKGCLGVALTPAQAAGDQPLVLLTPGVLI